MKRKLLSLLLVITLLAITVSTGIPTILAADENLIINGDFSSYSGNTPSGWRFDLPVSNSFSYEIVEDVEIPDGPTTNAMKFTSSETHIKKDDKNQYVSLDASGKDARMYFSTTNTVRIEKNATYTTTFWVKTIKTHAFTTLMFEPNHIVPSKGEGVPYGQEGHNIYSYKTSDARLRNSRPEINHVWTVAQSGKDVANYPSSMCITRYQNSTENADRWEYMYEQPLTPDFPKYEKQGEWTKMIYTFSTDNDNSHEADVAFTFRFPQVEGGEVWIADLQMTVQKAKVDGYYTPANKAPELGAVSKNVALPQGKTVKLIAEPFGENKFVGWYKGDSLVSTDTTFSFTYDPTIPPEYEARFEKAKWGSNGSLEGLTTDKVASVGYSSASTWTANSFKAHTNGALYVDSVNAGSSNSVNVVADATKAHTGTKFAKYTGKNGYVGYKFTGLNKNTSYYFSTYAYVDSDDTNDSVTGVYVTDANSGVTKLVSGAVQYKTATDDGVRYYSNKVVECIGTWKKIEVKVNTGDSTDVILWVGSPASGKDLYLDNFAVAREPYKFSPTSGNLNLGYVSPIGGADAYENEDVTVTATPLDGNGFAGWYLGDQLVSKALTYTHKYDINNTNHNNNLVAKFTAGPYAIDGAGFENQGYTSGQKLLTHVNGYVKANGQNWDDGNISVQGKWSLDSVHDGIWQTISVDTKFGHTGNTSVLLNCRNSWAGYEINGLKANTKYTATFYAWAYNSNSGTLNGVYATRVVDADKRVVVSAGNGTGKVVDVKNCLGGTTVSTDCRGGWTKVVVPFTTKESGDVKLWICVTGDSEHDLHMDNLAVFESATITTLSSLGGDIEPQPGVKEVPIGSYVELTAKPYSGNTFEGWYNSLNDQLVSTDPNYSFNATEAVSLIAKFAGDNIPPTDVLKLQGMDGTFEEGTVTGWWADDPTWGHDVGWCRWEKTSEKVYEGTTSIIGYCRYRSTNITFKNLLPNTDYYFSMYINLDGATEYDNTDKYTQLPDYGIMGPGERYLDGAQDVLVHRKLLRGNAGWQRIDMYFNTGDRTSVTYSQRITGETGAVCYYDNIQLIQYDATAEFTNGDFGVSDSSWRGFMDISNGTLKVANGQDAYQTTKVGAYTSYTVKFRAKGNGTVAAQRLEGYALSVKDYVSSVSHVDVASTDWKEYSFDVYTGVHEAINLLANGGVGGLEIDDVTMTRNSDPAGAILEKIDFETERFGVSSSSNTNIYSIYTAEDENDTNVLNGNKSLKFTHNPLLASTVFKFDQGYTSYQVHDISLKVSFNYKIAEGSKGGSITLAPEVSGEFGSDIGFEHTAKDDGWYNVTYFLTSGKYPQFKLLIANVMDATTGDFYLDDIIISIAPPMVEEENTRVSYCEALYNAVDNEGFEQKITDANWKGLTANSKLKVMSGDALKGSKFLRAQAGAHYVLTVDVKPSTSYYFGASVRGTAKSSGYIGISLDPEGTALYANRDDQPASKVSNKKNTTDWNRTAFKFTSDGTGKANIVIHVDSGYIDIDSVMMFTQDYSYRYDPNDYMVYVPYDYDNLKSSTTVINGGFGEQPYYKGDATSVSLGKNSAEADFDTTEGTPDTGDSYTFPVIALVLASLAIAVIAVIKKRKEGANANA